MNIITLEQCGKIFQRGNQQIEAVCPTDMEFVPGIHFIYGKSGSGKSTLLHIMAGLEKPSSGRVIYDGKSLYARKDLSKVYCRDFGFVFQAYNLIQEFTVEDNITLPLRFDKQKDRSVFHEIVEELGIADKLKRRPMSLSGGEQQRVAIARAMVNRPKIIFADEPTGNLDEENGRIVLDLLLKQCHKYGTTLIMVTHDTDLLCHAKYIYQMRDGHLLKQEQ